MGKKNRQKNAQKTKNLKEIIQRRKQRRKRKGETTTIWRLKCFSKIYGIDYVYICRNGSKIKIPKSFTLKNPNLKKGDLIKIDSRLFRIEQAIGKKRPIDSIRRSYRKAFSDHGFKINKAYNRNYLVFEFLGK
ncbi:hypothetical protein M0811_00397 [Anaeramoeba ignava]|uniref:Uncharacterized protein n=1 Tax=Anaeramoeba ignava TaxID=1746090 RepID=A0A9Q0LQF5_ANAIG|nr:hypothetical protein M0811_00397 [Anaeramoeba ignava]